MGVLESTIDPRDRSYLDARARMLAALAELEAALDSAREGGGEKAVTRHHARGKLLARERIELLVDRDSPLLELSPVAGWGTDTPIGSAVVTAVGVVEDRICVIAASDPTVRGGAVSTGTLRKIQRAQQIAYENRLPMVCLLEATGIEPAERSDVFRHTGQVAAGFAMLATAGLPAIGAFFGSSTVVGGADLAGAFDYLVTLRFTSASRPVDHLADDERDALRLTRQCVLRCGAEASPGASTARGDASGGDGPGARLVRSRPADASPSGTATRGDGGAGEGPGALVGAMPKLDPEDLLAVPVHQPREILGRLLDGSAFDEDQPGYGMAVCTGWGTLHGHRVAVLANADGTAGPAESDKIVRFAERAARTGTPLLLLRHGRELPSSAETALVRARVPLLVVRVGAWHGLSGVADRARFRFAWPGAGAGLHHAALPPHGTVANGSGVRGDPARSGSHRAGLPPHGAEANAGGVRGDPARASRHPAGFGSVPEVPDLGDVQESALNLSGQLDDDGVIDPRDTRSVLGFCLAICEQVA